MKPRIRVPAGFDWRTAAPADRSRVMASFEATQGRRRLASWRPTSSHVNAILSASGSSLRNRARDLVRNNAYAASASDCFVANTVGAGIVPRSRAPERWMREAIQRAWEQWALRADVTERSDFYGLQGLVVRALFDAGEAFVRPLVGPVVDSAGGVPLRLQVLEADQVPIDDTRPLGDGRVVRCGIEMDLDGRRLAYHVYRQHPGDAQAILAGAETVRVPADEMLHVYQLQRPGQVRGIPWLTRAMVRLHLLDQYDDAELDRKKVAALIAGFIHTAAASDDLPGVTDADPEADNAVLADWRPGTLMKLLPGEQVTFSEPADVGGAYEQFQYRSLSAICSGMSLPYWTVTGDLRQANYSSLRAGLVEFRRRIEQLQHTVLVHQLCRPVWEMWLRTAIVAGAIPGLTPVLAARRWQEIALVDWLPPKNDWVDPQKDVQAEVLEIQHGLKSRSQAVAERGYDVENVDAEQAADRARERELGLVYGAAPNAAGGDRPEERPMDDVQPQEQAA